MFKNYKFSKYFYIAMLIAISVMFLDQWTKWLITETILNSQSSAGLSFIDWILTPKDIDPISGLFKTMGINKFLNFVMVWNRGISFGIFDSSAKDLSLIFIIMTSAVCFFLIIWLSLVKNKYMSISLALLIGGAMSNIFDRIHFGAVVDFIDIHISGYHWPAFNLADSSIAIGAVIMIFITFTDDEGKNNEKTK